MAEITIIDGQIVQQSPDETGIEIRDGVIHSWEEEGGGGLPFPPLFKRQCKTLLRR